MMTVALIVGARPQFIKAAALHRELRRNPEKFHVVLIHTGQHFDENMSEVFFRELDIPLPDRNLGIGGGTHGQNTGRMIEGIEACLMGLRPDCVIVPGDTDSTAAGALAAVKLHVPVMHVEAGLRSHNRRMPEEINRIVADHVADSLMAPCERARETLLGEGIPESRIQVVGDLMLDAAAYYAARVEGRQGLLEDLGVAVGGYVLATIHRQENTDDAECLQAIFGALGELSRELPVVLPLHPRTRKALQNIGWDEALHPQLLCIDPVGFLDMVVLEKNAKLIVTDSGGIQKEAFFHGVPCVTLRQETEWTELVDLGWNSLVCPTDRQRMLQGMQRSLEIRPSPAPSPYGNGDAARRIADCLVAYA